MNDTAGAPAIRAFGALATGVHAVSREEATTVVRRAQGGNEGPPLAERPCHLVWIDVANPGEEEARFLREELGLHPLAVEDTLRGRQRPKIERYPGYFFMVVYSARVNDSRERMALNELHLFLGEAFIITVHDHRVREVSEVVARWRTSPEQLPDVGALAHALLDAVVDDYFPVLEHLDDRTEEMEKFVFHAQEPVRMQEILALRHELVVFRKVVSPLREVLSSLLRRDLPFLRPELLPYFQDVFDHTIRIVEEIDTLRELITALLEAHLAVASNQLNATMRVMTAWSIILMAVAVIAGIYGMNFPGMPELRWRHGYAFALGAMGAVALALLAYFRRRRWL